MGFRRFTKEADIVQFFKNETPVTLIITDHADERAIQRCDGKDIAEVLQSRLSEAVVVRDSFVRDSGRFKLYFPRVRWIVVAKIKSATGVVVVITVYPAEGDPCSLCRRFRSGMRYFCEECEPVWANRFTDSGDLENFFQWFAQQSPDIGLTTYAQKVLSERFPNLPVDSVLKADLSRAQLLPETLEFASSDSSKGDAFQLVLPTSPPVQCIASLDVGRWSLKIITLRDPKRFQRAHALCRSSSECRLIRGSRKVVKGVRDSKLAVRADVTNFAQTDRRAVQRRTVPAQRAEDSVTPNANDLCLIFGFFFSTGITLALEFFGFFFSTGISLAIVVGCWVAAAYRPSTSLFQIPQVKWGVAGFVVSTGLQLWMTYHVAVGVLSLIPAALFFMKTRRKTENA